MVWKSTKPMLSPDKDAGWGLIYRLNNLWARVDYPAEEGDYDSWNAVLDRIYCNLLYRNPLKVTKDPNGEIVDISIEEEPHKVYKFLTKKVFEAKKQYQTVSKHPVINKQQAMEQAYSKWYHAVMRKDVWLRKYMQELGLYLKELERSPANALFGGSN